MHRQDRIVLVEVYARDQKLVEVLGQRTSSMPAN
jgi:hypothetical protein